MQFQILELNNCSLSNKGIIGIAKLILMTRRLNNNYSINFINPLNLNVSKNAIKECGLVLFPVAMKDFNGIKSFDIFHNINTKEQVKI